MGPGLLWVPVLSETPLPWGPPPHISPAGAVGSSEAILPFLWGPPPLPSLCLPFTTPETGQGPAVFFSVLSSWLSDPLGVPSSPCAPLLGIAQLGDPCQPPTQLSPPQEPGPSNSPHVHTPTHQMGQAWPLSLPPALYCPRPGLEPNRGYSEARQLGGRRTSLHPCQLQGRSASLGGWAGHGVQPTSWARHPPCVLGPTSQPRGLSPGRILDSLLRTG
jgi:hypothetical protein